MKPIQKLTKLIETVVERKLRNITESNSNKSLVDQVMDIEDKINGESALQDRWFDYVGKKFYKANAESYDEFDDSTLEQMIKFGSKLLKLTH